MRQEMGFFDKTRTGELVNRLSADTTLVGQSVSINISDGLRSVAQAIGGVGMMVSQKCMNNDQDDFESFNLYVLLLLFYLKCYMSNEICIYRINSPWKPTSC